MKPKKALFALLLTGAISLTACAGAEENDRTDYSPKKSISTSAQGTYTRAVGLKEITPTGPIAYDNFSILGVHYLNTSDPLGIPFRYGQSYGYADVQGNPLVENLPFNYGYNFSEGYAFVGNTVIDTSGQTVFEFTQNINGGYFKDGLAVFARSERVPDSYDYYDYNVYICTLDRNMNYTEAKVSLPKDMHIRKNWYSYNDSGCIGAFGLLNSSSSNQIGITDAQGTIIASFDGTTAYTSASAAFSFVNFANSMSSVSAINLDATDLSKIIFPKNGYVNVMNENGRWGLMSLQTGEMVIDYQFDYVGAYSDGLIPVCQYGSWGAIDLKGNIVIPCKSFKYIGAFTNGRALAIAGDESICVIDKSGKTVGIVDADTSGSTLAGRQKSMFYTDFAEGTGIACIYLREKAWLISDTGKILQYGDISSYDELKDFLYMNNEYVVFEKDDGCHVYKIQKR